jgi:hypothetical protein
MSQVERYETDAQKHFLLAIVSIKENFLEIAQLCALLHCDLSVWEFEESKERCLGEV